MTHKTMRSRQADAVMRALGAAGLAAWLGAAAGADTLEQIKAESAAATAPVTVWDGPTTGPKAAKDKFIVVISDT